MQDSFLFIFSIYSKGFSQITCFIWEIGGIISNLSCLVFNTPLRLEKAIFPLYWIVSILAGHTASTTTYMHSLACSAKPKYETYTALFRLGHPPNFVRTLLLFVEKIKKFANYPTVAFHLKILRVSTLSRNFLILSHSA